MWWGLVIVVVCGCYSPVVPQGSPCGEGDVCPANQRCVDGRCISGDGDRDAPPIDVGIDGTDGSVMLGWSVPVKVNEISTSGDDFGASLFANQTRIYVASNSNGSFRIHYASRNTTALPFSSLSPSSELDGSGDEYDAEVSAAGLELHFISGDNPNGLRRTARPNADVSWTTPVAVVPGLGSREGPSLAAGDLRLMVSIAGSGGVEEYGRATVTDAWALLRRHTSLDNMQFPGISADGLELYATRDNTEHLYRATRATINDPFGQPQRVMFGTSIDSRPIYDPELTSDGQTMYLSINVGQGFDIYKTTR